MSERDKKEVYHTTHISLVTKDDVSQKKEQTDKKTM